MGLSWWRSGKSCGGEFQIGNLKFQIVRQGKGQDKRAGPANTIGTRTARRRPFVPQDKPALQGKRQFQIGNLKFQIVRQGEGQDQRRGAEALRAGLLRYRLLRIDRLSM